MKKPDELTPPYENELEQLRAENESYKEVLADKRRITKEIDIVINAKDAAGQPSLIDVKISIESLVAENKRLREALECQIGLWNLAKDQLDKFDDTLSRVRFTTLHNPQGHIAAALKEKP